MASLIQRAGGSLAVKALPALYGVGLVLLVVRAIPTGDFGQYGMAIAYMNVVAGLSRGLWTMPLVIHAAKGERGHLLAPSFWLNLATALLGGIVALILLPLLNVSHELAVFTALMLLVLVPRDIAIALAQAAGRVWVAFTIEAGYFVGSLAGFIALTYFSQLRTAEAVMIMNLASAALSALIGVAFEPCLLHPGRHGDWKGIFHLGKWIGMHALGEIFLQQGDALLVGIFFQPAAIAPYIAARTLLRMYTLLSQSVNFLVLPSASRLGASNQIKLLRKRLRMVLQYVTGFLTAANVVMWFAAPVIFPLVLGAKYIPAIPFFRVLIMASFLEPVYSILANAVAGIGKPSRILPILAIGLLFNIAANLVLLPMTGLWAAPVVLVATYGWLAFGMVKLARKHLIEDPISLSAALQP
ncbi:MAG TPA: oligosaccharide flippase family protein [bacterium]